MKLSLIIENLRQRCPSFAGRVSGAAEYKPVADNAKMPLPSAWVIPLDDHAGEQRSQTDYWQAITDGFAVVVVMDNSADPRGQQAAFDAVHDLRAELWQALLGWQPAPGCDAIQYDGGNLLEMNRAHLYYQFDFSATMDIAAEDTRHWQDLQALNPLTQITADTDFMTPDGVTEHSLIIPLNNHSEQKVRTR